MSGTNIVAMTFFFVTLLAPLIKKKFVYSMLISTITLKEYVENYLVTISKEF